MLKTKYFVVPDQSGKPAAQPNPGALGNCWLVKGIQYLDSADAKMAALDTFNPADTAVKDKRYQSKVGGQPQFDSSASIKLIENINDTIRYDFHSTTPQFAIFSEIYYDKGWKLCLDGNKTDYVRADYVLHGMTIPAGNHKIEFIFEPQTYKTGNNIALEATILGLATLIAALVMSLRKKEVV